MQGMESGSRVGFSAVDIAAALHGARLSTTPLTAFPGLFPETLAEAYAIQDSGIARLSESIVGWKVAGIRPEFAALGANRLAGPVMAGNAWSVPNGGSVDLPVFPGGFAAIEAEFVAIMGRTVTPDERLDADGVAAAVASLHVGAESAGSPFAAINDRGPLAVISDFGNNNGVIIGPAVDGWQTRPWETLDSRAYVNDALVGEGSAAKVAGGPLAAVAFLVENLGARGIPLPAGAIISTGMTTGIHPIVVGDRITFEFMDDIRFHARAVPARAAGPAS